MEFQTFLDPFGTALQQAGTSLKNDAQSIQNATNLFKLGMAKEKFDDLKKSNQLMAKAFQDAGLDINGPGSPSPSSPSALFSAGKAKGVPPDPIDTLLQDQLREYKFNKEAALARATTNPEESQKYSTEASKILKDIQGTIRDKSTRDVGRANDLATMFAEGAQGPEQFGNALRLFMEKHPNFDPTTLESKFGVKMGPNGVPMEFDANKFRSISQAVLTAKDRMTLDHQKAQEGLTAQLRKIEEKRVSLEARRVAVAEALMRDRDGNTGDPPPGPGVPKDAKPNTGDKSKTGDDYLATLPVGEQALVKGIAEAKIDPKTLSNRQGERKRVLTEVLRYNPEYQQSKYQVYQAVRKDFATGTAAKNVTAINTAIGHAGTLYELGQALDNKDTQSLNRILNVTANELGDPRINNFEVAASALSSEMMRVFRQVGASEKEQHDWETRFSRIQSPEQIKGAIRTAISLLKSRIDAVDEQWKKGMDTKKGYPNLVTDHSANVLRELGVLKEPDAPKLDKNKAVSLDDYLKAHGGGG